MIQVDSLFYYAILFNNQVFLDAIFQISIPFHTSNLVHQSNVSSCKAQHDRPY